MSPQIIFENLYYVASHAEAWIEITSELVTKNYQYLLPLMQRRELKFYVFLLIHMLHMLPLMQRRELKYKLM